MKNSSKKEIILIVEDDIFLSDLYKTKMELEGFKVLAAYDGEKGLELAQKNSPNIILLDLILPKLSGFGVLEKLKANKATQNIPVIILTNLSQKSDVEKGLKIGANDYLIKAHFMPSEVVEKIKRLMSAKS
ncbi:MAG: response regulator [Patescibacteria group bacterium]|jgi:DNA-binding response OmpR family regulator